MNLPKDCNTDAQCHPVVSHPVVNRSATPMVDLSLSTRPQLDDTDLPCSLSHSLVSMPVLKSGREVRSLPPDTHELRALQQLAAWGEQRKQQDSSIRKEHLPASPCETLGTYADPLSPLRERDLQALTAHFQRDDMYAIESDLNQMLLRLMPEPCWEDDVFGFLHEFL